jgi:hypothetical protein
VEAKQHGPKLIDISALIDAIKDIIEGIEHGGAEAAAGTVGVGGL